MSKVKASGTEPGQRRLNGLQTSGREFRNLSTVNFAMKEELNVAVPLRDGTRLLADLLRPDGDGRFPALVAFSPYPRQLQNSGLPMGFVEAGASDFFVPRGYAHLIVNARGTCGSGGTYGLLDAEERRDLHDTVEWAAAQPWCDGNVGMIGISYFAMAQIAAAVEHPPHLKALFPFAVTTDFYRGAAWPGGMLDVKFLTSWLRAVGIFAEKGADFFRGALAHAASAVLRSSLVHKRFEHFNGEAAATVIGKLLPGSYAEHPFGDLMRACTVEHQLYDDFWRERDWIGRLGDVRVPIYLGCDWDNVPLHLACTFPTYDALPADAPKRVAMLPRGGLAWPWESMHVEALAWFDKWLKGRDTGVDEGPPIRYWLEGAEEWRATSAWPPPEARYEALHLRADGRLSQEEGAAGARDYWYPSPLMKRDEHHPSPLPAQLAWETAPLAAALDVAGPLEVELDAATSATDADWIFKLVDVAPDGKATDLTQGWLRASGRAVDEQRSRPGAPFLPLERAEAVQPGERVRYRVPLVSTARRFLPGHRVRLLLASSDGDGFAMLGMEHQPLAAAAKQTIFSSSRILLPVLR